MLNKKMLNKEDRHRWVFPLLNFMFETTLDRLSAECIVLGTDQNYTPTRFMQTLQELILPNIHFDAACVNNRFVQNACFVNRDIQQATQALFSSQFDHWLYADQTECGAENIQTFKQWFYQTYYSQLHAVEIDPAIAEKVPVYRHREKLRQYGVLRQIIAGTLVEGDNVVYLLCPIECNPKRSYHITAQNGTPFFGRLFERRGDDLIVINADTQSAGFLMALMETVPCELDAHKQALLCKLATLLSQNGKTL